MARVTRLSGNCLGENVKRTFRNQRHHPSPVTRLVPDVFPSGYPHCSVNFREVLTSPFSKGGRNPTDAVRRHTRDCAHGLGLWGGFALVRILLVLCVVRPTPRPWLEDQLVRVWGECMSHPDHLAPESQLWLGFRSQVV